MPRINTHCKIRSAAFFVSRIDGRVQSPPELGAYFRHEDPGDILFREWSACKRQDLQFSDRDTWDRMLEQGIRLLIRFCQEDRIRVAQPACNLQIKFTR